MCERDEREVMRARADVVGIDGGGSAAAKHAHPPSVTWPPGNVRNSVPFRAARPSGVEIWPTASRRSVIHAFPPLSAPHDSWKLRRFACSRPSSKTSLSARCWRAEKLVNAVRTASREASSRCATARRPMRRPEVPRKFDWIRSAACVATRCRTSRGGVPFCGGEARSMASGKIDEPMKPLIIPAF